MQVTLPTREQLSQLVEAGPEPTVSIYMPTHRTGRDTRQDPIRLKNLLDQADAQLEALGCDQRQRDELLAPARDLPDSVTAPFWQHGNDGLSLFLRKDLARCHKLPVEFTEVAFAADRFLVTPLLDYFQGDGHFWLLAASRNKVRLFAGSKHNLAELDADWLPKNLQDALNIDEYQSALQFHSHTTLQDADGEAMYHGHGGGEGEDRKSELWQYFRRLNDALTPFLNAEGGPLVFAGVEYLFPIFRQTCRYKQLADEPLTGNPDDQRGEQLHPGAWQILEPQFLKTRQEALERFGNAAARGQATEDLEQVLAAVMSGRVETLLVSEQALTLRDERHAAVAAARESTSYDGSDSLLEALSFIAVETLRTSGAVYLTPVDEMPGNSVVAAIFRY